MAVLWAVGFKAGLNEESMKSLITETRKAAEEINEKIHGREGKQVKRRGNAR